MINYTLHPGDVLDVVSGLPDNTYSAVFCDPPYGLGKTPDMTEVLTHWLAGDDYKASGGGFMGKAWDSFVPGPSVWKEIYRVCKPGAVLLAFGGTRTADLLSIAIRLAGWQRWDELMYIYGSGFPKGHDISKAIDKAAGAEREVIGVKRSGIGRNGRDDFDVFHSTCDESLKRVSITAPATPEAATWAGYNVALKPAFEPILCFRKPLESTYAHSALTYGTGALNVDGCRVPISDGATMARNNKPGDNGWKNSSGGANNAALHGEPNGRWPANLIHSGDPEVMEVFDRAGTTRPGHIPRSAKSKAFFGNIDPTTVDMANNGYGDTGSAARYFMCCPLDSATLDNTVLLWCNVSSDEPYDDSVGGNTCCENASIAEANLMLRLMMSSADLDGFVVAPVDTPANASKVKKMRGDSKQKMEDGIDGGVKKEAESCTGSLSTDGSGKWPMDLFQMGMTYTTLTETSRTTICPTCKSCNQVIITLCINEEEKTIKPLMMAQKLDDASDATIISQSSNTRAGVQEHIKDTALNASGNTCKNGDPRTESTTTNICENTGSVKSNSHAARFFYCAKASSSERSAGLDGNNPHPTLKPLSLCEYLARLIVPPESYRDDAQLLIPYAGVGSEAIGAAKAGWRNITGIELDAEYCEINQRRFDHWAEQAQTVQPALLEVA